MHPTYEALNDGAWLNGVLKTGAQTAAVSRGTSHATGKQRCQYTTSVDIKGTLYKRIQSLTENHIQHERSESAREQRTALYKSDQ